MKYTLLITIPIVFLVGWPWIAVFIAKLGNLYLPYMNWVLAFI